MIAETRIGIHILETWNELYLMVCLIIIGCKDDDGFIFRLSFASHCFCITSAVVVTATIKYCPVLFVEFRLKSAEEI